MFHSFLGFGSRNLKKKIYTSEVVWPKPPLSNPGTMHSASIIRCHEWNLSILETTPSMNQIVQTPRNSFTTFFLSLALLSAPLQLFFHSVLRVDLPLHLSIHLRIHSATHSSSPFSIFFSLWIDSRIHHFNYSLANSLANPNPGWNYLSSPCLHPSCWGQLEKSTVWAIGTTTNYN